MAVSIMLRRSCTTSATSPSIGLSYALHMHHHESSDRRLQTAFSEFIPTSKHPISDISGFTCNSSSMILTHFRVWRALGHQDSVLADMLMSIDCSLSRVYAIMRDSIDSFAAIVMTVGLGAVICSHAD